VANSLAVLPEKKPVRQADKANIALAKDHLPSILGLLHIGNNHIRSLRMKKMMLWVGVLVVILGGVLRAQSSQATPEKARPMAPNADPSFEVALSSLLIQTIQRMRFPLAIALSSPNHRAISAGIHLRRA